MFSHDWFVLLVMTNGTECTQQRPRLACWCCRHHLLTMGTKVRANIIKGGTRPKRLLIVGAAVTVAVFHSEILLVVTYCKLNKKSVCIFKQNP